MDSVSPRAAPARLNEQRVRIALYVICFALPFLARLYVLSIPVILNIDEAQWTVSARHILDDPIFWRSNDLTTSGPLNGLAIAWTYLFGMTPTIFTSRVTGLLMESLAFLGIASLIRRGEEWDLGSLAVLSVAVFLAFSPVKDFLFYSSELLSIDLIVLFWMIFVGTEKHPDSIWRWALCGFIATCLPFAKLQSAIFCVLLHGACVVRLYVAFAAGRANWKTLTAYAFASLLPALLLVVPLFFVGEQQAFITGYLLLGAGYAEQRTLRVFYAGWSVILCMSGLMAAVIWRYLDIGQRTRARLDLLLFSVAIWPTVFLTIWVPGRNFAHYNLYAIFCLPLAIVLAQRAFPPRPAPFRGKRLVGLVAAGIAVASLHDVVTFPDLRALVHAAAQEQAFAGAGDGQSRPLLAWTGVTPANFMLMWGWKPDITAYAGLKPAGRVAHTEYMIRPNNGRAYFRARLLRDVTRAKPALVMDAVRPVYFFNNFGNFRLKARDFELRSFPALYNLVTANYDLIGGGGKCESVLYLRRDLAAKWRAREIPLHSDIAALTDGSLTERCGDWWAPDRADATAVLSPDRPTPIYQLWILASRGGRRRARGTTWAQVRFVGPAGDHVVDDVHLFDYPKWTVVSGPAHMPVVRIEIRSLKHVGEGAALNEVKAFRYEAATAAP